MDTAAFPRPWADLLPDLLRHVSGRLHDANDFVRFHAVCRAWRDTRLTTSHPPSFLPWLLVPGRLGCPTVARFRTIFTTTNWCAASTPSRRNKLWLASADGAGTWLLTFGAGEADPSPPRLVNPFTGSATTLPPLRRALFLQEEPEGIVCADGTVALFAVVYTQKYFCYIAAAVLRPGDAAWTEADSYRMMYSSFEYSCAAAYSDGEIVLVDDLQSRIVTLRVTGGGYDGDDVAADEVQVLRIRETTRDEHQSESVQRGQCIYALESRGELLAVRLTLPTTTTDNDVRTMRAVPGVVSASLYALEKESADGGGRPRWVRRDGRSLRDRVLFLGCPTSFAVDAARFGGAVSGGCAYFALDSRKVRQWTTVPEACRVYRYSFEDGSATVVEELPAGPGWDNEQRGRYSDTRAVWFAPQPSAIAPSHEIRERALQAANSKQGAPCQRGTIPAARTGPRPHFKVFIGNLPSWLDSIHLKQFFVKHGHVADARVIRELSIGRSWGFGFVTMATMDEPHDAIAALDGEIFCGHVLCVKSAEERRRGPFLMTLLPSDKKAAPRIETPSKQQHFGPYLIRIYVENLPWDVDTSRLHQFFSEHGQVADARVIYDAREIRSIPLGFGFVTMATTVKEPAVAVAALDGQILDGHVLRVSLAEELP